MIHNYNNILAGDLNTNLNASNNSTKFLNLLVYSSGLVTVHHNNTQHTDSASTRIEFTIVDDLDEVLSHSQHDVSLLLDHDLNNIQYQISHNSLPIQA